MSVTKTTSIIFGLNVSELDFLKLDENELFEKYNVHNGINEYVYLSGDGDDYFGIPIDIAQEGSYDISHLETWTFEAILNSVTEQERIDFESFVQEQFSEPEGGYKIDFMITVTYS